MPNGYNTIGAGARRRAQLADEIFRGFEGMSDDEEETEAYGCMFNKLQKAKQLYRDGKIQEAIVLLEDSLREADALHPEDHISILFNLIPFHMAADNYTRAAAVLNDLQRLCVVLLSQSDVNPRHYYYRIFHSVYKIQLLIKTSDFEAASSVLTKMKYDINRSVFVGDHDELLKKFFFALRESFKADLILLNHNDFNKAIAAYDESTRALQEILGRFRGDLFNSDCLPILETPQEYRHPLDLIKRNTRQKAYAAEQIGDTKNFINANRLYEDLIRGYRSHGGGSPHIPFVEVLLKQGILHLNAGKYDRACDILVQAMHASEQVRDPVMMARTAYALGLTKELSVDFKSAEFEYDRAAALLETAFPNNIFNSGLGASVLLARVRVLIDQHKCREAQALIVPIKQVNCTSYSFPVLIALLKLEQARLWEHTGRIRWAGELYAQVIPLLKEYDIHENKPHYATALLYQGMFYSKHKNNARAISHFRSALVVLNPYRNADLLIIMKILSLSMLSYAHLSRNLTDDQRFNTRNEPRQSALIENAKTLEKLIFLFIKKSLLPHDARRVDLLMSLAEFNFSLGEEYFGRVDEYLKMASQANTGCLDIQIQILFLNVRMYETRDPHNVAQYIDYFLRCFDYYNEKYFSNGIYPTALYPVIHLSIKLSARNDLPTNYRDKFTEVLLLCGELISSLQANKSENIDALAIKDSNKPLLGRDKMRRLQTRLNPFSYERHDNDRQRVRENEVIILSEKNVQLDTEQLGKVATRTKQLSQSGRELSVIEKRELRLLNKLYNRSKRNEKRRKSTGLLVSNSVPKWLTSCFRPNEIEVFCGAADLYPEDKKADGGLYKSSLGSEQGDIPWTEEEDDGQSRVRRFRRSRLIFRKSEPENGEFSWYRYLFPKYELVEELEVTEVKESPQCDFPQMTCLDSSMHFSWGERATVIEDREMRVTPSSKMALACSDELNKDIDLDALPEVRRTLVDTRARASLTAVRSEKLKTTAQDRGTVLENPGTMRRRKREPAPPPPTDSSDMFGRGSDDAAAASGSYFDVAPVPDASFYYTLKPDAAPTYSARFFQPPPSDTPLYDDLSGFGEQPITDDEGDEEDEESRMFEPVEDDAASFDKHGAC